MRPLTDALVGRGGRSRVLLTTLSGEGHGLGLLMAEAMFVLSDCECVQLGLQTLLHDIADAVTAHKVDIVAPSFGATLQVQSIANKLTDLRNLLPPDVRVWVGGSSPAHRRKLQDGVDHVLGSTFIEHSHEMETVASWMMADEKRCRGSSGAPRFGSPRVSMVRRLRALRLIPAVDLMLRGVKASRIDSSGIARLH